MPRNERKDLIVPYWNERAHSETLISEFIAVRGGGDRGRRSIDAVIVHDGKSRWLRNSDYSPKEIAGKEITVIQAKLGRLGMNLLGQALFSKELMQKFRPRCIKTIALCEDSDAVLAPLAKKHGIEIVSRSEFQSS